MRSPWWWVTICVLTACGGRSEKDGDNDDSSAATGGNVGTGGNATTGGNAGTSGAAGGPAQWAVACSQGAGVSCQKWFDCSPHLAEVVLPADCETSSIVECMTVARLPDITISPSEYQACVEVFESMSCDDWLYRGAFGGCQVVPGTRPNGGTCSSGLQCASGACSAELGCGVCVIPATAGESCGARLCGTGLECGVDGVCVEARHLGDPCDIDSPCSFNLNCVDGVCAKRGGEGTSCAGDSLACDFVQGLICGETYVCEPIAIPGVGEACTGICAAGAVCNDAGRCVAALGAGQTCSLDGLGQDFCDRSLECMDGVCSSFDPAWCG